MTSFWRGERFWARKRVESYGRCLEPAKVAVGRAVGEALGYVTQRWGGAVLGLGLLGEMAGLGRLWADLRDASRGAMPLVLGVAERLRPARGAVAGS